MKAILFLILVISLCTGAVAGQRSGHDCCPDQQCSLQCLAMGCAPAALAIAPPPAPLSWAIADAATEQRVELAEKLPSPWRSIWVPPD